MYVWLFRYVADSWIMNVLPNKNISHTAMEVRCRNNTIFFLQNIRNRHSLAQHCIFQMEQLSGGR